MTELEALGSRGDRQLVPGIKDKVRKILESLPIISEIEQAAYSKAVAF